MNHPTNRQTLRSGLFRIVVGVLATTICAQSNSQGFGKQIENDTQIQASTPGVEIGRKYWLNFNPSTKPCRDVLTKYPKKLGLIDNPGYDSRAPIQVEIVESNPIGADLFSALIEKPSYKVKVNDSEFGFIESDSFPRYAGEMSEENLGVHCVLTEDPLEIRERIAKEKLKLEASRVLVEKQIADAATRKKQQATKVSQSPTKKKPGVTLGMTSREVIEETSWGKPQKINRNTSSAGINEQWVYGSGNYLYFKNGILYSIQN